RPAGGVEADEGGAAARLVRQTGTAGPEDPRASDRLEVELIRSDLHVGRLGGAIEEDRKSVRRVDFAKDDGGAQRRVGADPPRVHAEALKRSADVRAEAVVTDLRDHGGPAPESCRADGDI